MLVGSCRHRVSEALKVDIGRALSNDESLYSVELDGLQMYFKFLVSRTWRRDVV